MGYREAAGVVLIEENGEEPGVWLRKAEGRTKAPYRTLKGGELPKMRQLLLAGVLMSAMLSLASANDLQLSKIFDACMAKADGERGAIATCYEKEFPAQDARLNVAYKKLLGDLDESRRIYLRDTQRDWIKSRDSTCALTIKLYHNSWMRYISEPWCRTEETARRAGLLEDMKLGDD